MILRAYAESISPTWAIDVGWLERKSFALEAMGEAAVRLQVERAQARFDARESATKGDTPAPYTLDAHGRAWVKVHGPLMNEPNFIEETCLGACCYLRTTAAAQAAAAEGRTVVLDINSPGGEAIGVAEAAAAIRQLAVPTVAYVRGLAASAAYWLAAACDRIVASPVAEVGSLGAVVSFYTQELPAGMKHHQYVSQLTPRKRMEVGSEEFDASLQRRVDDLAAVFLEAVGTYRKVEGGAEVVAQKYGQGDVFGAAAALTMGMVDAVGTTLDARPEEQGQMGLNLRAATAAKLMGQLGEERFTQLAGDGADLDDEQANALLNAVADEAVQAKAEAADAQAKAKAAATDLEAQQRAFESKRSDIEAKAKADAQAEVLDAKLEAEWATMLGAGVPPRRKANFVDLRRRMAAGDEAAGSIFAAEFGSVEAPKGVEVDLSSKTADAEIPNDPRPPKAEAKSDPLAEKMLAAARAGKNPLTVMRGGAA